MLESPPREKQWVSWLFVLIWVFIIFVTIPVARSIRDYVYGGWGQDLFTYVVLAAIVIALAASAVHLRRRSTSLRNYGWLFGVAAVFAGYTIELKKASPEEAIHFIQYGILGLLVYRALTHRVRDVGIYVGAAIICGLVGTMDEAIQWLTPNRYWGLRDIGLNFLAGLLVVVAIAKGARPSIISGWPGRENLGFLCRLGVAGVVLLGASLINTPARIAWYAERIPWLAFLKTNESVMAEYGHLYKDPSIGIFRSRLTPNELSLCNRHRGEKAAEILDRFQGQAAYKEFLKIYTPVIDPFVHEARVHLFRRDWNFGKSRDYEKYEYAYARHLTIAFRENQIMERYFSKTLHHSAYVWSPDERALAQKHVLVGQVYNSGVSRTLITRVTERQIAWLFACLFLGLVVLSRYFDLGRSSGSSS